MDLRGVEGREVPGPGVGDSTQEGARREIDDEIGGGIVEDGSIVEGWAI